MKKHLLLLLISTLSFTTQAFTIDDDKHSHQGVIVLNSDEKVHGIIYYEPRTEIVQCQNEMGTTKAYSPNQVKYFQFYDHKMKNNRKFVPLAFSLPPNQYKSRVFFEVVLTGYYTLLRKQDPHRDLSNNPGFMQVNSDLGFSNQKIGFVYYLQDKDGVREIKKIKKELFPTIMQEQGTKVKAFVSRHRLKMYMMASQIIVVNYFNFLQDPLKNKWEADNLITAN